MKRLIKNFFDLNVNCSKWFLSLFPKSLTTEFDREDDLRKEVMSFISQNKCSILEVGGIDRPLLQKSDAYIYDGLDIDYNPNCNDIYNNYFVQSIEEKINKKYDLIFSKTVLEHVPNTQLAFASIFNSLNQCGLTIHHIPSKWHPYSILLRLVGNRIQKCLINYFRPQMSTESGYPAFFNHCCPKDIKNILKNKVLLISSFVAFILQAIILIHFFLSTFLYFYGNYFV